MKFFSKIARTSKRVVGYETHKTGVKIIGDFVSQTKDAVQNKTKPDADAVSVKTLSKTQRSDYAPRFKKISYFFMLLAVLDILLGVRFAMTGEYLTVVLCVAFLAFCAVNILKYQVFAFQMKNPSADKPLDAFKSQFGKRKS